MALIGVKEVMELTQTSESGAYLIIRTLNQELRDKGYLTQRGRCPEKYLLERFNMIEEGEM